MRACPGTLPVHNQGDLVGWQAVKLWLNDVPSPDVDRKQETLTVSRCEALRGLREVISEMCKCGNERVSVCFSVPRSVLDAAMCSSNSLIGALQSLVFLQA